MKILSIQLKNLASLAGEHFIDFEADPLASSGLIAIVGKTGAGKSTILDAMCLALYNRMPRLKESDGKLIDIDGTEFNSNSPTTILRHGTAHAFAELCFIAPDQKRYKARWEIKRAREQVGGKLQSVQRSITCLTDGVVLADKTKAVEAEILKITQLSFEQFTRAVLLAQSEVTAFLKARDHERGELLEYLTNSSIFAKIGELAAEKTKQVVQERKNLENILGHIELLTDEELSVLKDNFATTQQELLQHQQQLSLYEKQKNWFSQQQKLEQDIAVKKAFYVEKEAAYEASKAQQALLAQLDTFSDIRPEFIQQQKYEKELQLQRPKLKQQQEIFSKLEHDFNEKDHAYQQAEQRLTALEQLQHTFKDEFQQIHSAMQQRHYLTEELAKVKNEQAHLNQELLPLQSQQQQLNQALTAHTLNIEQIQQTLETSQLFKPLDHALAEYIRQLQQYYDYYESLIASSKSKEDITHDLHTLEKKRAELDKAFGSIEHIEQEISNLNKQNIDISQKENSLKLLKQKTDHLFSLDEDVKTLKHNIASLHTAFQEQEIQVKEADVYYHQQRKCRETTTQILQEQRLLHTENIEKLREQLHAGQACLVCGSTSHPYIEGNQQVLNKSLFALQEQQEQQAKEKERLALDALNQSQLLIHQTSTQLNQAQLSLNEQEKKYQISKNECLEHIQHIALEFDLQQDQMTFNSKVSQYQTAMLIEQEQNQAKIETLNLTLKEQQWLQQQISNITRQLERLEQFEQQIQPIIACLEHSDHVWKSYTLIDIQRLIVQLKQRNEQLNQYAALVEQQQKQQYHFNLQQKEIEHLHARYEQLSQQAQAVTNKGKQNTEHAKQLLFKITNSSDSTIKVHEWLKTFDQEYEMHQGQYRVCKQHKEQLREHFEHQKNEVMQLQLQIKNNQQGYDACHSHIKLWLEQHPHFDLALLHDLQQYSADRIQALRQSIQQLERQKQESHSAVIFCQEQLNLHLETKPAIQLDVLTTRLAQAQEMAVQLKELLDGFKVKLDIYQQNLEKQKKFQTQIDHIQQQEHRWYKISSLIGDSKGKKFRDQAQQYHLDILLEHANQQLAMLSQRYTLKRLQNSLSLAIIDHDMNEEVRSVASLSGGESFLTALALSLAIANMASGSMKIESLFIDEGFGTLDASSLHMVMNALDQLQSQGRKVVLISHIADMHERIPVQIQVQPLGSGSSQVKVVG